MFLFDREPVLSIEDLTQEMDALEKGSFTQFSDEELKDRIGRIYDQFMEELQELRAGEPLCRAVKVAERPAEASRVSYAPEKLISRPGRLNRVRQSIFYCSSNPFAGILECKPQIGDLFAVSAWIVNRTLRLAHLGYSEARAHQARRTPFAIHPAESERNRLIRKWQGRVFTKFVDEGQEELYRLPIALKEIAMYPNGNSLTLSGVLYPSIASDLTADNLALIPSVVDQQLTLFEVLLFRIVDLIRHKRSDNSFELNLVVHLEDVARPHAKNLLVWGQQTQIRQRRTSAHAPFEGKLKAPPKWTYVVLAADFEKLCNWSQHDNTDHVTLRTGSEWQVNMW